MYVDDAVQAQVVVDEEQHKSTFVNSGTYSSITLLRLLAMNVKILGFLLSVLISDMLCTTMHHQHPTSSLYMD